MEAVCIISKKIYYAKQAFIKGRKKIKNARGLQLW